MAIGKLSEELWLSVLPQGLTFTVTAPENSTHDQWYTYFEVGRRNLPYTVEAGKRVATSVLSTTYVLDSGPGLSNKLRFKVSGQLNGKQVNKEGYFIFSSTDWPLFGRPDNSILTFQFDGTDAVSISQQVRTLVSPDPYYFGFAVKDDQLLMVVSRENNIGTAVMSKIIDGILTLHTKAIGWVFGKIL